MDTSNPVVNSDRRSLREVKELCGKRRRQDLQYLQTVAESASRTLLPCSLAVLPEGEVKDRVQRFVDSAPKVDTELVLDFESQGIEKVADSISITGLKDDLGVPLHPPSIHQAKGQVSTTRRFGGARRRPLGLKSIMEVVPVVPTLDKIYTHGTAKGFQTRIAEQMSRPTRSIYAAAAVARGAPEGTLSNMKTTLRLLDELMPYSFEGCKFPSLDGDLDEILEALQVTGNASAGAPYWRNKVEAMPEILGVGIPWLVKHIKEGTIDQAMREQPEMFLCEVKNKLDRYSEGDLPKKTRPYMCFPAHLALLFSCITQKFQEALFQFDGDKHSMNAYGWSSANGGVKRLARWMLTEPKWGGADAVCYGDDTRIKLFRKDGVYTINPDAKQMDGSVDRDTIDVTVEWMISAIEKHEGQKLPFWREVAKLYKKMACSPLFVIQGTTVYGKKSEGGLMTGVPGTTLFDTVKGVVSWRAAIVASATGSLDLLDKAKVEEYMKRLSGIVVKEGTYEPEKLPRSLDLVPYDTPMCEAKFLGVQIMKTQWRGEDIYVPTIPRDEMYEMLLVQKDDPFGSPLSSTAAQRKLFDRMRGLMITACFTDDEVSQVINHVVNGISPEAVLMQVQLEGGERPDSILLSDFSYPDSDGFPSRDFCCAVYAGEKDRDDYWISLWPSLKGTFTFMRSEAKRSLKAQSLETGVVETTVSKKSTLDNKNIVKSHKRSKIEEGKYLPNLGESIALFIWRQSDDGVLSVGEIYDRFGCSPTQLLGASQTTLLFITSFYREGLISLNPIQTPFKSIQDEIFEMPHETKKIQKMPGRKDIKEVVGALHQGDVPPKTVLTVPDNMFYSHGWFDTLTEPLNLRFLPGEDPLQVFAKFCSKQKEHYQVKWKTKVVEQVASESIVKAMMLVKDTRGDDVIVASAESRSALLAKQYVVLQLMLRFDEKLAKNGRPTFFHVFLKKARSEYFSLKEEKPESWTQGVIPSAWQELIPERPVDSQFLWLKERIERWTEFTEELNPREFLYIYQILDTMYNPRYLKDARYIKTLKDTTKVCVEELATKHQAELLDQKAQFDVVEELKNHEPPTNPEEMSPFLDQVEMDWRASTAEDSDYVFGAVVEAAIDIIDRWPWTTSLQEKIDTLEKARGILQLIDDHIKETEEVVEREQFEIQEPPRVWRPWETPEVPVEQDRPPSEEKPKKKKPAANRTRSKMTPAQKTQQNKKTALRRKAKKAQAKAQASA